MGSSGSMDPRNWMGALGDKIKHLTPSQIVMVGSHNSGSFTSDMTVFARNQWNNIGEQLRDGVRSLDIRITRSFDDFYMHHSGHTSPRQSYIDALHQIRDFLKDNPREVIVLYLSAGHGSSITKEYDKQKARQLLTLILRERLVSYEPGRIRTFGQLWDAGKNIIVIVANDIGRGDDTDAMFFWPYDVSGDTWGDPQSDANLSLEYKIQWVHERVTKALPERKAKLFWMSCSIWTIDVMRSASDTVNPKVSEWLRNWARNEATRSGLNIVGIDNANSGDREVVRTVLSLYADGVLPSPTPFV